MACLNCGGDDDYGPCVCIADAITHRPTRSGSMRALTAKKLAARSPLERAVATIDADSRRAFLGLAEGSAVSRRVHTSLHQAGMVAEPAVDGTSRAAIHRPTLTALGLEAVALLKSRQIGRKEVFGALAGGE